jgi:hypothetical protein
MIVSGFIRSIDVNGVAYEQQFAAFPDGTCEVCIVTTNNGYTPHFGHMIDGTSARWRETNVIPDDAEYCGNYIRNKGTFTDEPLT